MATTFGHLQALCPLCGTPVLFFGPGGRLEGEDVHPIPLGRDFDRGYSVCDDCALLADTPAGQTLN